MIFSPYIFMRMFSCCCPWLKHWLLNRIWTLYAGLWCKLFQLFWKSEDRSTTEHRSPHREKYSLTKAHRNTFLSHCIHSLSHLPVGFGVVHSAFLLKSWMQFLNVAICWHRLNYCLQLTIYCLMNQVACVDCDH